jgi:2-polyprenyl-3-methyl-5-hydroxy-6-metoxy-1,4-benzoquinol methylase
MALSGVNKLDGLSIVDYGCGWGDFLDAAKGYGVDLIGYDEDIKKASFARERGHFVAQDINELRSAGPVDVIIMNSVLEHIQDIKHIFGLVKSFLKSKGFLVFSVMDYRSRYIEKNIKRLNNNLPALTKNLNPLEHVNIYNYKSVKTTLEKFNFEFLSTRLSLEITNVIPFLRKKMSTLKFVNGVESLFSKIIIGQGTGINVYARKK